MPGSSEDEISAARQMIVEGGGHEAFSAVTRVLAGFNREQIGSAIEVLIALLDTTEPDPDDERDGSLGEDDFCSHNYALDYPGCPISDPDAAVDDGPWTVIATRP